MHFSMEEMSPCALHTQDMSAQGIKQGKRQAHVGGHPAAYAPLVAQPIAQRGSSEGR